ncbi:MAG: EamA family transporter [Blastochloris sp.]|nr:EamA family transporter [Blastochloris sp.]
MIASLATACFFALSAVFGSRASRMMGPVPANTLRLSLAAILLAFYALIWGQGWAGPGLAVFLLSGLIGFGLGDISLFLLMRRSGRGAASCWRSVWLHRLPW